MLKSNEIYKSKVISKSKMSSISDIVNAKIIELLLECCRKTVIECSQHYGFSSEEALGKMGLLTDYTKLYLGSVSDENQSVSDVSVKTPILDKAKKVSKPRVKKVVDNVVSDVVVDNVVVEVKEKKVSKPRVKKDKVEVVAPVESPEGVSTEVIVKEKKVSKPRAKKVVAPVQEVVVSEVNVDVVVDNVVDNVVVSDVKEVEKPKKVSKPRVKKEKNQDEDSTSSGEGSKKGRPKKEKEEKPKGEKGRPKKEKKETEVASPIDDLFANLVLKEEEPPQVDVVNKMDFQGTTYLKSKNTGIIYNMEQDVVGKWNENTNTIDFEEEEEEEYEDE